MDGYISPSLKKEITEASSINIETKIFDNVVEPYWFKMLIARVTSHSYKMFNVALHIIFIDTASAEHNRKQKRKQMSEAHLSGHPAAESLGQALG